MNICFINPSTSPRPEIYGLAKYLPSNYDITILQASRIIHSKEGFQLRENVYVKNIPTLFLSLSGSKISLPILHSWLKALSGTIKEDCCDLIHVCDYEYLTSIIPLFIRQMYEVPTLIANDALLGGRGYVFGSGAIDLLARFFTPTIGKKVLEGYDKVVFIYSKLAKEAQMLGIPDDKIAVIANGIDAEKVEQYSKDLDRNQIRHKFGLRDDEKVILSIGRLVGVKRIHILIDTVKKLVDKGYKVRAIIVGEGSEKRKLEDLASTIKEKVVFTGFISEREKYECYAIAELFMLPSLSEGLPTVLLESATMGVPAIATNINGIPDIVVHNKTGLLVDVFDTASFIENAITLIEHKDLVEKMGENAKEHVRNNFSWDIISRKYQGIYKELATATK